MAAELVVTRTLTSLDTASPSAGTGDSVPPATSEAERALDQTLETVDEQVRRQVEECRNRIRSTLLEPLQRAVREAASHHRRLVEQARFADDEVGDKDLWVRVANYRDAVRAKVIDVIGERFSEQNLGHGISQTWLDTFQTMANLGSVVDAEIRLPEDPALFASDEDDPAWRRLRKFELRSRRRVQAIPRAVVRGLRSLVGRPAGESAGRTRVIPARAMVDYHLQARVPHLVRSMHDSQQETAAQLAARLEDAVTSWTYDFLAAEAALDRPHFHQLESAQTDSREKVPDTAEEDSETAAPPRPPLETVANALQEALDAVAAAPLETAADEELFGTATAALRSDMARAGTFLLDLGDRRLPAAAKSAAANVRDRQQLWSQWHREASNRFELNRRLLAFRQELRGIEESFIRRITTATLEPVHTSFQGIKDKLRTARQQSEQAFDATDTTGSAADLARTLRGIQATTLRHLQSAWRDLPGLVSSDQALSNPGVQEWQMIVDLMSRLPDKLSVHSPQPDDEPTVVPGKRTIEIDLQQIARDAMSLPLPDQLADEAAALKKQVIEVWTATEKVQDIVRYNLGAALDELEASDASDTQEPRKPATTSEPADDAEPTPPEAARQLIVDGLRRAAGTLTELEQSLLPPWQTLADEAFHHVHDDWLALHKRISAEAAIEERWLGFQTRIARRAESTWQELEEGWQRMLRRTASVASVSTRRLKRLIKRGQAAVGVSEKGDDVAAATLDAIADIKSLHTKLPLVYRRLFSFDPLTEPSLFEGRSRDLVWVRQHLGRWKQGRNPGVLVLPAPLGAGRTTVLNVLATTVFDKTEVHRLDLNARVTDSTAFAAVVATALDLELPDGATLDDLETQLVNRRQSDRPSVCLIDNLEHCLLAAPGYTEFIDRVLIFLSRTDSSVYWVATIGDLAWQYVQKTAPATAGLVTEFSLPPLDGKALEELILNRHGRSGMPLRFATPKNPSALLKQRLRRAKAADKRQLLLRMSYFDSLAKACGGSVLLALFYWLRSTDFDAEPDVLTIKPIRPLDFRFFSGMDLNRAFTLKAFLIHNTLSQAEHARVLRLPDEDSFLVLESLLNNRIIENVTSTREETPVSQTRVVPSERYQIRPLLVQPVTQYLSDRNIIY